MENNRRGQADLQYRKIRISSLFMPFKSRSSEAKPYNTPPIWSHHSTISFHKSSLFEDGNRPLRYSTEGGQISYQSNKPFQDAELLKFQNQFNQSSQLQGGQGSVYDVSLQHQQYANQMLNYGGRLNHGTPSAMSYIQHPPAFPVPIYPIFGTNSQHFSSLTAAPNYNRRVAQQMQNPAFSNSLYSVK